MYEFLTSATQQYIDDCGKLRGLIYEASGGLSAITLVTPPLHPTAIPSVDDLPYTRVGIKRAKIFANTYNFRMVGLNTSDDTEEGTLFGLWYEYIPNPSLGLFYIPILEVDLPVIFKQELKIVAKMKKLPRGFTEEPCKFDLRNSKMRNITLSRMISMYLKQIVVYIHANGTEVVKASFKVSKTFINDVIERLKAEKTFIDLSGSDRKIFLTKDNHIKVPSGELIPGLLNYLDTVRSNTSYVSSFIGRQVLMNDYSAASDFRQDPSFYVFGSKRDVISYLDGVSTDISTIHTSIMSYTADPYLLANYYVSGDKVVMIQNTSTGTVEDAKVVCRCWYRNNVNGGYHVSTITDMYPTSVKPLKNEKIVIRNTHTSVHSTGSIEILDNDNGTFSAILPID